MNIDWAVAGAVFFILVGWAFGYYLGLFGFGQSALAEQHQAVSRVIVSFLSVSGFMVPVEYNSSAAENSAVLYFYHNWPDGNRSTARVFSGGETLDCQIIGDNLYWVADLSHGKNAFEVVYAESGDINCTGAFDISGARKVDAMAAERITMLSPERIGQMQDMPYSGFKRTIGSSRDFRVVIETEKESISYGPEQPPARETYVHGTWTRKGFVREPARVVTYIW